MMHGAIVSSSHPPPAYTPISTRVTSPLNTIPHPTVDYEEHGNSLPRLRQSQIVRLVGGTAGVQVAFAIQYATGISYFHSLGINQSLSTALWFIPPLCGTFLQPLFGRWSDLCRDRKSFIALGGLGLTIALVGYAWSPELAVRIAELTRLHPAKLVAQLAVPFFFLILNISVQLVQTGLRALMIDHCHASQQAEVNAWASRINHIAGMLSYLLAASTREERNSNISSQLHYVASFSIFIIIGSLSVTCYTATQLRESGLTIQGKVSGSLLSTWGLLSSRLRRIYLAQFFSWFAWFPIIVQITSFVDELSCMSAVASTKDECTATGSSALFNQACIALVTSFLLPLLVRQTLNTQKLLRKYPSSGQQRHHAQAELHSLWILWLASQILFAALIFTMFYKSRSLTMLAMSISGVCWSVTQWVPFVLTNAEVIRIEESRKLAGLDSRTGVLLGAHNIFIAFPQILATGVSSILLDILKATGNSNPLDDILWVFSMSICASLSAAYFLFEL